VFEDGVHLAEGLELRVCLITSSTASCCFLWRREDPHAGSPEPLRVSLSLPFSHILLPASPQSIPTSKGQEEVATFFEVVCTALGLQS